MVEPNIHNTLGAGLIGSLLCTCFYGLTTLQTYTYFGRSQHDHVVFRGMIGLLWTLDTVHTIFVSHAIYTYTVSNFGNPLVVIEVIWSVLAELIVAGLSDTIVRLILCYRIWRLSHKNIFLTAVLALSTMFTFFVGMVYGGKGLRFKNYEQLETLQWLLYVGLGSITVTDLLISGTLCVQLLMNRSEFKRANSVVRTLILYTVATAIPSTLAATACLIAYIVAPHTFIYIAFYFQFSKLLLNSLLATLNARRSLRENLARDAVVALSAVGSSGDVEFRPFNTRGEMAVTTAPHNGSVLLVDQKSGAKSFA